MRLVSYGGGEDDDEVDVTKSDAEVEEDEAGENEEAAEKEASERDDNSDMDLVRDTTVALKSSIRFKLTSEFA